MTRRMQTRTTHAVRGLENRTIKKLEDQGWELVSQRPGTVRTELTFQRPIPDLRKPIAVVVAGFVVLGGIGALGALLDDEPEPRSSATITTKTASSSSTTAAASSTKPASKPYSYAGPSYEIVIEDEAVGPAQLTEHWVVVEDIEYSTAEYKNDVKLILADIARSAGTADLIAHVVTDDEIALAEAASTYEAFIAQHGEDYAINAIPKKEVDGWVASYTGGLDQDSLEPSQKPQAYEIHWRPYADGDLERWKPAAGQ